MAEKLWPGEDPIGRRFTFGDPEDDEDPGWRTVVGIVGDVRHDTLDALPENEAYIPMAQAPFDAAWLVVRSAGDPMDLAGEVREAVRRVDPELPLASIETVEQVVAGSLTQQRFNTTLMGIFAALALVLAAVGIYGVVSYGVSQRVHEMGLRMALGAGRGEVRGMVVRQGMAVVLAGVAVGLVASFAATRLLETFLYGIRATDPLTFVVVPAVLALVAFLASWLPAARATRVDPMVALRAE
jgi:putative ABC transport system permease protein